MNKIDLLIFDMDGTIIDSSESIFSSIRHVERSMGLLSGSQEQLKSHLGPTISDAYGRNYRLNGEELDTAIRLHNEFARSRGYLMARPFEGIINLFQWLTRCDVNVAVATLKNQTVAERIIDEYEIIGIAKIVGAVEGKKYTKIDLVRKCSVGVPGKNIVVIGDGVSDLDAARDIGANFIAITYGYDFKQAPDGNDVIASVSNVEELKGVLQGIVRLK